MSKLNKTAVMYGAGNIGRGFIGQVFHDSGYEVVFIDVNPEIVAALEKHNSYTQLVIDDNVTKSRVINNIRAVDGRNKDAVVQEIINCDIMAVSVGTAVLPHIAPYIACGIKQRDKPFNILVCENLAHAPDVLKDLITEHLDDPLIIDRVGFVGTTIGRMVPVVPPEQRVCDPALIAVEKFCTLPLDADSMIEPIPELQHAVLCSPFAFEVGKKLYIHNMGHALAAYYGFLQDFEFIWQAMEDTAVRSKVHEAMYVTAEALARKYYEDRVKLNEYAEDLLSRFANKGLGDTVARVGGDPMRKLAPGDRLTGAIDLCCEQGVDYLPVASGIAAALHFYVPGDPSSGLLQARLNEDGVFTFLRDYCKLQESIVVHCGNMYSRMGL